ncbi:MAG: alpha-glucan family phosphorylase [Bacteroidales bacterium]
MSDSLLNPDYLFEVSWEVCNKIGGIHTVISTKAASLRKKYNDNYICIGPDVWKETHGNPEFQEDKLLFSSWQQQAEKNGLHVRVGRWNIPGSPIAILVDFTPLFGEKDKLFTDLWLKFGLNSLGGQWDYVEPAMFGYAAGQVIESFYDYHLTSRDRLIAHFHEWMTGSGVLYLSDKVPQAATVFTTHATTLGRSLAGHGKPLYNIMDQVNPEDQAAELGITSKFSLEQLAAKNADSFTTVSAVTAYECEKLLGKRPDVVTPNGFDLDFVPDQENFAEKRKLARHKLLNIARGLLNQPLPDNAMLVAHSGRYEFKNKGIDLFIDALSQVNKAGDINQPLVAFILVPANQTGLRPEVAQRIKEPDYQNPVSDVFTTHKLVDEGYDPVIQRIKSAGLHNRAEDQVKMVFIPAYMNGEENAFHLNYYDALIGFDFTIFPSYYEPWGYTPMESVAFHVPTITTSQAGFGQWVREHYKNHGAGAFVLDRNDENHQQATEALTGKIMEWASSEGSGQLTAEANDTNSLVHHNLIRGREQASQIAQGVLWDQLVENYLNAYKMAVDKVNDRQHLFREKKAPARVLEMPPLESMQPRWKKILVEISIPKELELLNTLARNVWWSWNYQARDLFESIDPKLWEKSQRNPIILLQHLTIEQFNRLAKNKEFMKNYQVVREMFESYMAQAANKPDKKIAYFSMEYGLHESIKIYSGGLGVLAGDYLKQASDDNVNLVGVGLLYRYGYFSQNLSINGEQLATYHSHNFTYMAAVPVRDAQGKWVKVSIALPGRVLSAKVWKIDVGRIPLYLMDTDIPENNPIDKFITHQLYGGDWENRFRQEFLLGIGGIRLLEALGLAPDVYHLNEGHAAFAGLERLRMFVQEQKLTFSEALEMVRGSSLFTTHTPVPAGHDAFNEDMLRTYMPHYADRLGISWETFMGLGKVNTANHEEHYSMSVLATKLSQEVNGVSKLHGKVSREMFKDMYPGYFPEELHISHVTNGVHYGTWVAKEWQQLYEETFGKDFLHDVSNPDHWKKIYGVADRTIWNIRNNQRSKLVEYIKERLLSNLDRRQETPRKIYQIMEAINSKALTIGFARRFATYKRAHLLFNDMERLSKIVNNPDFPVQFIYAGKAHPADQAGQDLIKHIVEISKRKEFRGKVIFLEDYDMELGAALTQGVDIWLNTPTRPLEASGTSGEKAVLNGVMNFSVLDGWYAEGHVPEAGWALKEEKTFDNQALQDELDAASLYNTLENEIIPKFYNRDKNQLPTQWVQWIKNCIAQIAPHYANKRMLDDYFKLFYNKLFERSGKLNANNYQLAREMAYWKYKVSRAWDSIEVESMNLMNTSDKSLLLGESFKAEITLDLNEISHTDFGLEVVFIQKTFEGEDEIVAVMPMHPVKQENDLITFSGEVPANRTGVFKYAFRMFPLHPDMPHRQDFPILKWL